MAYRDEMWILAYGTGDNAIKRSTNNIWIHKRWARLSMLTTWRNWKVENNYIQLNKTGGRHGFYKIRSTNDYGTDKNKSCRNYIVFSSQLVVLSSPMATITAIKEKSSYFVSY